MFFPGWLVHEQCHGTRPSKRKTLINFYANAHLKLEKFKIITKDKLAMFFFFYENSNAIYHFLILLKISIFMHHIQAMLKQKLFSQFIKW